MIVLLSGGPYAGDMARIELTPPLLAVSPCDCIRQGFRPCGERTHWQMPNLADVIGDAPRGNVHYYTRDRPWRPDRVRYLHAGSRPPEARYLVRQGVVAGGCDGCLGERVIPSIEGDGEVHMVECPVCSGGRLLEEAQDDG